MAIQIKEDNLNSNILQGGVGVPSHFAETGTLFIDKSTGTVYINKDGASFWADLSVSNNVITGGTITGGIVTGATLFTGGLSANTISATTYLNIPTTNFTGGTYANGVITLSGTGTLCQISLTGSLATKNFGIVIDGGGSVIQTGIKGELSVPYNIQINSWTLVADTTGSTTIDIWKTTYASYPTTSASTIITGGTKPNLSNAIKNQTTSISGWNTLINSGDILIFNVDSATTITRATLTLNGIIL